jgi:hypothetical protein
MEMIGQLHDAQTTLFPGGVPTILMGRRSGGPERKFEYSSKEKKILLWLGDLSVV